ncbi:MAG: hypothetical protein NT003_03725 [Candidatus Magasanikbacteria bacterium]|nr:hypothetical protein [Candidatus Magasanikbacteria bacterium]
MKNISLKLAAIGGALLILGAGCSKTDDVQPVVVNTQPAAYQGVTVPMTYNPGGLAQKEAEIKAGDSIQFRNSDLKAHYPASAPHPTHTDYPGFDPKAAIAPGETWTFKFDKVGDWKFHDHLAPTDARFQGVIHVK